MTSPIHAVPARAPLAPSRAIRLVGLGFRCGLTCVLPRADAARATATLHDALAAVPLAVDMADRFVAWGLAVACSTARPLTLSPVDCDDLSGDERRAVALIAALQHPRCPALDACAVALLGTAADTGRVLAAAAAVADGLARADVRLGHFTVPRLH